MLDGLEIGSTSSIVGAIYLLVEAIKFTVTRIIAQRQQLELLSQIAKSMENISKSQEMTAIINQEMLDLVRSTSTNAPPSRGEKNYRAGSGGQGSSGEMASSYFSKIGNIQNI